MTDERKTPDEVAKEALDRIKAENESAAKVEDEKKAKVDQEAEARGAAEDSPPKEEKTKEQLVEEAGNKAVEQAKKDKELADKKEDELSDEEKARKADLDQKKAEEKEKARKDRIESRMNELNSTIKRLDDEGKQYSAENKTLKAELEELKAQKSGEPDTQAKLNKAERERNAQYLEEDTNKPLAQRREMSKEDLNDWLDEDRVEAHEWMINRQKRRDNERDADISVESRKHVADDFIKKQQASLERAIAKHPGIVIKDRFAGLLKDGKTKEEANDIILAENDEYRILTEVTKENEGRYLKEVDGPEQAISEMERRLKLLKDNESDEDKKKREEVEAKKKEEDEEARLEQIREEAREQERQRKDRADEGLSSTRSGDKPKDTKLTEADKYQQRMAAKAGIKPDKLAEAKRRRESIAGAA